MTTFAFSSVFIFFYVWEAAFFFSDLYLLHISDWKGNKPRKLLQYPTIFSNVQKSYNILTTYHALKLFSQPTPGPKQFVHCFSPQNVLDPIFFSVWVLPFPSWPDPIFLTPSSSLACCRMGSSRLCIMLLWCRVCVCVCGHGCPLCIYVYINCIFKWFGPLRGGGGEEGKGKVPQWIRNFNIILEIFLFKAPSPLPLQPLPAVNPLFSQCWMNAAF